MHFSLLSMFQVLPATSTESISSAVSYRQRSKSPTRTPSFCAAISASLMSLDEEMRKKEAEMLASRSKMLKIKSSTPKSIACLPPSPQVPNQTSTPAPDQIIAMSTSQCNTIERYIENLSRVFCYPINQQKLVLVAKH